MANNRVRLRFFNHLFGAEETRRHITQSGSDETSSCSGSTIDSIATAPLGLTCDQIGALLFGLETLFTIEDRLKRQGLQAELYQQAAKEMAITLFECISKRSRVDSYETLCEALLQGTSVVRANRSLIVNVARVVARRLEKRVLEETSGDKGTVFTLAVSRVNELAAVQGVVLPSFLLKSLHLLQNSLRVTELVALRSVTLQSLAPQALTRRTSTLYGKVMQGFAVPCVTPTTPLL
eukprot:TRINITY_DN1959_c4_g1_i1.p1 TRINITY_DN1959_c4_g1~~TRINITY_DN1959_c4_g1_i1.p1  ORF type:complete len:236 (+),score=69.03 TRINITY_DN1959_c4_g1_i1:66-773(+)